MLKKILLIIVVLLLTLTAAFGGRLFWLGQKSPSIVNNIGLENGQLKACGDKPNCVSSSADPNSSFYIEPLKAENIEVLWDDLMMLVQDLSKDQKQFEVKTEQPDYIHMIAISKIFGFVDDVEFHLLADQGLIEMRSQSRVGYGDLGANRKRLEKIRSTLRPNL